MGESGQYNAIEGGERVKPFRHTSVERPQLTPGAPEGDIGQLWPIIWQRCSNVLGHSIRNGSSYIADLLERTTDASAAGVATTPTHSKDGTFLINGDM